MARRFSASTDKNQDEIVNALRKYGLSVTPTHRIGKGYPDICVGYEEFNFLIEIKLPKSVVLTKSEEKWHGFWLGQKAVCTSAYEVLIVIHNFLMRFNQNTDKIKQLIEIERTKNE